MFVINLKLKKKYKIEILKGKTMDNSFTSPMVINNHCTYKNYWLKTLILLV